MREASGEGEAFSFRLPLTPGASDNACIRHGHIHAGWSKPRGCGLADQFFVGLFLLAAHYLTIHLDNLQRRVMGPPLTCYLSPIQTTREQGRRLHGYAFNLVTTVLMNHPAVSD